MPKAHLLLCAALAVCFGGWWFSDRIDPYLLDVITGVGINIILAVSLNLVAFSSYLNDLVGQVFALFVLTVAAAESAIGLAIVVVFFRNRGTIAVEEISQLKG